jgi:hypothetical protein
MRALRYSPRPQYAQAATPWYESLSDVAEKEAWRVLVSRVANGDAAHPVDPHAPYYLADNARMGLNALPIDRDTGLIAMIPSSTHVANPNVEAKGTQHFMLTWDRDRIIDLASASPKELLPVVDVALRFLNDRRTHNGSGQFSVVGTHQSREFGSGGSRSIGQGHVHFTTFADRYLLGALPEGGIEICWQEPHPELLRQGMIAAFDLVGLRGRIDEPTRQGDLWQGLPYAGVVFSFAADVDENTLTEALLSIHKAMEAWHAALYGLAFGNYDVIAEQGWLGIYQPRSKDEMKALLSGADLPVLGGLPREELLALALELQQGSVAQDQLDQRSVSGRAFLRSPSYSVAMRMGKDGAITLGVEPAMQCPEHGYAAMCGVEFFPQKIEGVPPVDADGADQRIVKGLDYVRGLMIA